LPNTAAASAGSEVSSRKRDLDAVVGAPAPRAREVEHGDPPRSDLVVRIVSAVVLAPVALGAAVLGGWPFVLLCALAAIGIWWEWATLSAGSAARALVAIGAGALAAAAIFLAFGWLGTALACLAGGAALVAALAPAAPARQGDRTWVGAGVAYAGTMLLAPVLLRGDPQFGLLAIMFLFAVVWTTDIVAYFAGRALGGAKLAPLLSPNKTWSGALGGAVGAVLAAILFAASAGIGRSAILALVALGLSIAAQAGDLFESAFKRRYGAKDAGRLIPGHGGLMDRLDGFIAAALAATILGLVRGGVEAPARGLLVW
jgi:phosphatidate cytidylyltransferase